MAVTTVFAEQELTFVFYDDYGLYMWQSVPAAFNLTVGQEYRVKWGEDEYSCTAFDASGLSSEAVGIGNLALLGGEDTGEPFAMAYLPASGEGVEYDSNVCLTASSDETRFVAIYQGAEDEAPEEPDTPTEDDATEGIVLKDRNGKDVAYYGIETVTFDTTTEGKQQTYTKGVAVEGLEIIPDFSGGDIVLDAPTGTLVKSAILRKPVTEEFVIGESEGAIPLDFSGNKTNLEVVPSSGDKFISKVIVEKPETLVPENIAEGVDIAGIIGAFKGGGVKFASGSFSVSSAGYKTINHGLEEVPNFVVCVAHYATSNGYFAFIGFSTSMKDILSAGVDSPRFRITYNRTSSGVTIQSDNTNGIETTTASVYIHKANETSFTVYPSSNGSYHWFAISGLT